MKSDNLFDIKFTFLDAVKILLLIVTMFSTWNIVDVMTPDGSWAWVRELAAVGMVEGAFLGFEAATANAKSKRQVKFATIGFFCSLVVITLFAGASGLLEFGGPVLLAQSAANAFGIAWTGQDVVTVVALAVLVVWIGALAALYRIYSLADPDAQVEIARIDAMGDVAKEEVNALRDALTEAKPIVAASRAMVKIQSEYGAELGQARTEELLGQVKTKLNTRYGIPSAPVPSDVSGDAILPYPVSKEANVPLADLDGGPEG